MTPPVLVLWDLDLTLLRPAGFGTRMIAPALAEVLGREPVMDVPFAGRTDRAILTDLLVSNDDAFTLHDHEVAGPHGATSALDDAAPALHDDKVAALLDAVATRCEQHGQDLLDAGGGPLPGAHEAVRALSSVDGLHQGIVTGNMRRTALLKLRLCGFDGLPDPALGAYGDDHLDRAHMVRDAIAAARSQGIAVSPARSVVVGDTVHDVRGALDAGARCVGVATGRVSASDLLAAGAHAVLPDLTDAAAVVREVHDAATGPSSMRADRG